MMKKTIRAVVYDIDNTLYDYDAAHASAFRALTQFAGSELGIGADEFARRHAEAEREMRRRCGENCAALHNRLLRCQVLLEGMGRSPGSALRMARVYWRALLDAMKPCPGAIETLARLREQGYVVGVGTNMTAEYQYEKLIRIGAMAHMNFIVTSEEVTAEKPDRRLFDACVRKAGCDAEACVYVGDSLENDVRGALDAGMRAVWFCPEDDLAKAPPGALTARSHWVLPGLLAKL